MSDEMWWVDPAERPNGESDSSEIIAPAAPRVATKKNSNRAGTVSSVGVAELRADIALISDSVREASKSIDLSADALAADIQRLETKVDALGKMFKQLLKELINA